MHGLIKWTRQKARFSIEIFSGGMYDMYDMRLGLSMVLYDNIEGGDPGGVVNVNVNVYPVPRLKSCNAKTIDGVSLAKAIWLLF